jgi:hypothetical protein
MELMSFDEIHEIHEKYRVKHTFMKLQRQGGSWEVRTDEYLPLLLIQQV